MIRYYIKIVVDSMHERKTEMAKRVGAFVGLPGGYGTFEEVHEARSLNLTHSPYRAPRFLKS
jgi:hypothetical protein